MFDLGCVMTPGTQPRTSLIVFAGPFLNAVSGTTSTPPGVRWMMARACSVVGTVRLAPGGVSRPVAVGALVLSRGAGTGTARRARAVRVVAGWAGRAAAVRLCWGASTVTGGSGACGLV